MSTLKVTNIENPSTSSGGIDIDTSGHVTVDGLAMPSAGSLSNRNLIINGAMQVAQRGTSQTGVSTTTYAGPDRFQQIINAAGTWTISQSTEAPEGFSTSLKLDCTTANASLAAGAFYVFGQKIEGFNVQHLDYNTSNAKTVTLSFWVRSNKTGTYVSEITSDTSGRKISQTYAINSVNTWEKKTLQIPGDTGGSLQNTNAAEFSVYWWMAAGTDFTSGTLNTTWGTTADTNRVVGQTVNLADSTDNDFYITGVQLEAGSVATPFERRSYGQELSLCQRYYWKTYNIGTAPGTATAEGTLMFTRWNDAANFSYNSVQCPVPMRTAPDVTGYTSTGTSGSWLDNGSVARAFSVANVGRSVFTVTSSGSGAGTTGQIYGHLTASSEL